MTRSARPSTRFHLFSFAAIAVLCLAIYSNSLHAGWVLDDWDDIVQNPSDRWTELSLDALARTIAETHDRRPVAHVSFGLNHYFGGSDVSGYHWVNLLVHALTGILVYLLALRVHAGTRRASRPAVAPLDPWPTALASLFAALLFVAHPLQVQSVTYIVQRMTSLAACLYLAALLLALRAGDASSAPARRGWWAAALGCGLLAMGTKEIAFTLPAAYWLFGWCFDGDLERAWLRDRLVPIALFVACGFVIVSLSVASPGWERHDFGPSERLLSQARVLLLYASLIVWPLPSRLNLLHEFQVSRSLVDPVSTLASLAVLAAVLGLVVWQARPRRLLFFGSAWFALHLAIEAGPVPLRMVFEHRLYLPLVGVAILVSGALFAALPTRVPAAVAVAVVAVVLLSGATWSRNETWRDTRALWTDVAAKSPGDWMARMQMGSVLARAGRYEEALAEIDAAIRLEPTSPRPRDLRGAVLLATGRPEEALAEQLEAIRLDPGDPGTRRNAALSLESLGRLDQAAAQLEAAQQISPDESWLHHLGRVREQQGRVEEALTLYERALKRNPRHREALADAGRLLARAGRHEDAVERLSRALSTSAEPRRDAELLREQAASLWALGRPADAISALEGAEGLDPGSVALANDLAWMLATCPDPSLRDPERAVATVEAALRVSGRADAGLLDTLAAGHAAAGRFDSAEKLASSALAAARADGREGQAASIEARLALYRQGHPYVDTP